MKEVSESLLSSATACPSRPSPSGPLLSRVRYKLWALAAVLLLALWSMLAGTFTLKWSARRPSDDLDGPLLEDVDVLEMEERAKVVRHMWDVYAHSHSTGRLPRFWQQAFEAAYEELSGDDPASRDAAVAEIARLSMRMVDLEPPPQHPKNAEPETDRSEEDIGPKSNSSSFSSAKAR
ncbi:unnamed protein product [Musa acuminata subsp. malaccensis]|uniref:(wild Malaysian banana) hypothetical protein n=1 Tax=Musa acuminata subsp. malaccensis TaxID=214687 RepID=A0A804III5_MUSAM|nr:PREDICTED: uncharacterized protein LOC103979819 [Musa acuminata subsp. malaccensis]CAG1851863.1 unnamed protein product [Musa acuminata subsp. malaccensis]